MSNTDRARLRRKITRTERKISEGHVHLEQHAQALHRQRERAPWFEPLTPCANGCGTLVEPELRTCSLCKKKAKHA